MCGLYATICVIVCGMMCACDAYIVYVCANMRCLYGVYVYDVSVCMCGVNVISVACICVCNVYVTSVCVVCV